MWRLEERRPVLRRHRFPIGVRSAIPTLSVAAKDVLVPEREHPCYNLVPERSQPSLRSSICPIGKKPATLSGAGARPTA